LTRSNWACGICGSGIELTENERPVEVDSGRGEEVGYITMLGRPNKRRTYTGYRSAAYTDRTAASLNNSNL